jgi:hypothetical protein
MKRLGLCLLAAAAMAAIPSQASAAPSRLVIYLRADVAPFCRVWAPDDTDAVRLVDGQAALGQVREVCNTAGGYVLRADFSNLSGGSVVAGSETASVDENGSASFTYGEARAQTRNWQLTGAQEVVPNAPVYLRLSISPF